RPFPRLDDLGDLEAVHARHLHVEENRRKLGLQHAAQRFRAGVGAHQFLAEGFENRLQCQEVLGAVVDEKNVDGVAHTGTVLPTFFFGCSCDSSTRRRAILSSDTTSAVGTARIAASGMIGISAVFGSCTSARPPRSTMRERPRAPSSLAPVSTIPIAAGPYASAADSNITSMEGRLYRTGSSTVSVAKPGSSTTW